MRGQKEDKDQIGYLTGLSSTDEAETSQIDGSVYIAGFDLPSCIAQHCLSYTL